MQFNDEDLEVLRREIRATLRAELRLLLANLRPSSDGDDFLSVKSAAQMAGVCPATIRGWLHQGHLKRYGTPRLPRVRRSELTQFLERSAPQKDASLDIDEQAAALLARGRRS